MFSVSIRYSCWNSVNNLPTDSLLILVVLVSFSKDNNIPHKPIGVTNFPDFFIVLKSKFFIMLFILFSLLLASSDIFVFCDSEVTIFEVSVAYVVLKKFEIWLVNKFMTTENINILFIFFILIHLLY